MNDTSKNTREQSTIQFPYIDLDDAMGVARAILDRGGVPLDRDQLGAAMGLAPGSGNFSVKLGAARMFGLIETGQGRYQLTPLGFEILDPARERAAKAEAFLRVPLYRRVYDEFKGKLLPPRPAGLEQAFVNFGVAHKQKDRARHAFDRSARSAGYFPTQAEDRLVAPVVAGGLPVDEGPVVVAEVRAAAPPMAARSGLHPFIQGLLDTLPDAKSEWATSDRAKWLQAAAQIFDLIYTGNDGNIVVDFRRMQRPSRDLEDDDL